jgi:Flp pilus assembly protein TadD
VAWVYLKNHKISIGVLSIAFFGLLPWTPIEAQTPAPSIAPSPGPSATSAIVLPALSIEAQEAAADGVAQFRNNRLTEAKASFEKMTQLAPAHPMGWINLGSVEFRLGQLDPAKEHLQKAVRLDPTAEQAWLTLGVICYQKNDLDAGLAALSQAVWLNPNNSKAHLYLGVLIRKKGWIDGAEDEMRKALELNENDPEAHFNLAILYMDQHPPAVELAKRHYFRAVDLGAKRDPEMEQSFTK